MKLLPATGIVMLGAGDPTGVDDAEGWLRRYHQDTRRRPAPVWARPIRGLWVANRIATQIGALQEGLEALGVDSPFLRVAGGRANALAEILGAEGYVALSLAQPTAVETVALMRQEGIQRAVVMPADPHHDDSTGGRDLAAFRRAWTESGGGEDELLAVPDWSRPAPFLGALTALCQETFGLLRDGPPPTLFLAPASPGRDPSHQAAVEVTARALAERLELTEDRWALAELGSMAEPCRRDIDRIKSRLPLDGSQKLALVPFGFASDRMETLHILDRELTRGLRQERLILYRVPCLNDRPEAILALVEIVRDAAKQRNWLQKENDR